MPNFNKPHICCILVFIIVLLFSATALAQESRSQFHAIAYHGVVDSREQLASDDVTLETLVNHFEWLLANNYQTVSVEQLIQANKGLYDLPEKAVLLCWDDGYTNFYTHVFPLLKAYNFHAVLALVGDWMTTPMDSEVSYGNELVPREKFLSWEQVRDIAQSPLVEIASHSFDLHKGLLADRAGDMLPATITHRYDLTSQTYENDMDMFDRILDDLMRNNALILEKTGVSPRVMVWPFGRYNSLAIEAAQKAGMDITLTLDPVAASTDSLEAVSRMYPTLNPETGSFKYSFFEPNRAPLRRFIQVQSSSLLEEDEDSEKVFSRFLERTKALAPGRVYFEPTIMLDGTLKTIFRNNHLPVIQDRLNRLSWHTSRRSGTEVHLILSDTLFDRLQPGDYKSFFSDMGKSAPCSGLMLADDKFIEELLMEMADTSPESFTLPTWNPNASRGLRRKLINGTDSTRVLNILSGIEAFQKWQPFLDVGLAVTFDVLKRVEADSLKYALRYFDYIMVDLREEKDPIIAIKKFSELNTIRDIRSYFTILIGFEPSVPENQLKKQLNTLWSQGLVDYGYANDFFMENRPDIEMIKPIVSTRTFPFIPK